MANVPFPPFADRPVTAKIGKGSNRGVRRRTGNTFWHTMIGTLASTDAWFRHRDCASLTPWGIGGALDGSNDGAIYRFMDYGKPGDIVPWSSGPWIPNGCGDGQDYVAKFGVSGINGSAEAIENSGLERTPVSAKQWRSLIWLTAAIIHAGGRDSNEYLWRMYHREIACKDGRECPFPRITNFTKESTAALVALLRNYEGYPDQQIKHVIGGKTIVLPFAAHKQTVILPPSPVFVEFDEDRTFTIDSGGATVRQWGNRAAKIIAHVKPGTKMVMDGYYQGEQVDGDNRWLIQTHDPRGRVHISAFVEGL